ncbi:hypothetical protein VST7929_01580 [Vibrio stylophorae]|uniref:Uncharacterized protein n=1 Tax=Vibrio stylophorae TaxID=659351 RepID=A0ABN8DSC3_9VIBR|nr:hypothetical protein [Vibrio stylophorae]CAH0533705.1 hypothetical protein VST7929_01580 [Vibrio stylophorae]
MIDVIEFEGKYYSKKGLYDRIDQGVDGDTLMEIQRLLNLHKVHLKTCKETRKLLFDAPFITTSAGLSYLQTSLLEHQIELTIHDKDDITLRVDDICWRHEHDSQAEQDLSRVLGNYH